MATEFVKVARKSDLREGRGTLVRVGSEEIALFNVSGNLFAINNVCAHQHFSALHQGTLRDSTVTCPMHGWSYSVETGKAVDGEGCVKTYPVKIVGEHVFVEIASAE